MFGSGQQCLTYGTYAVSQAISTRLKLLKGEWWEDTTIGLPLYQGILGKIGTTDNISIIDTLIKKQIVDTTDVTGITEFLSTFDSVTRSYSFNCIVNTKYGDVKVNETL